MRVSTLPRILRNVEIGTKHFELRDAAEGTGADRRADFEMAQLAADDGVVGLGALGDGGDGEPARELGGQVLHAVDGEIDAAVEQGFFDFFGEETFAADFVEGSVLNFVAGSLDDFDAALGAAGFEALSDVVCLPERELRTPGPDHQHKF